MLVANARMYTVTQAAGPYWRALLAHVGMIAAVQMSWVDHAWPAPLDALWARPDLGCAFMCGWPFITQGARHAAIAVPVPDAPGSDGLPQYRAAFVVAADAPFTRLEDTFGHRFAYNQTDSHSGWNMPRACLARFVARAPLFAGLVGPTGSHRRSIELVAEGAAEVAAIDSWWLHLLGRYDPALASRIRVLETTAPSPPPLLVGNADLAEDTRTRLSAALIGLADHGEGRKLLPPLALRGFVAPDPAAYAATSGVEEQAVRAGYPAIA